MAICAWQGPGCAIGAGRGFALLTKSGDQI
jgi:hypothetical protein